MRFPQDVPVLTDGTVTLRPHRGTDAQGAWEQARDPESRRWTTVPWDYTLDDARRFVQDVMPGGWRTGQEWGFAVEVADPAGEARYAGTVSLRDHGEGRAEIAYGAHPAVRGTGTMERALRLLLAWGYEDQGLRTVVWWAHRGNWPSRRLAWRLGFHVEGCVRQWLVQRGELRDAWVGTLLAGDPRHPAAPWHVPPRLAGERVALRPLREDDVGRIVEGCRDAEVRRWLGVLPHPYGEAEARTFLAEAEERHADATAVTWAMTEPTAGGRGGDLVGVVNVFDLHRSRGGELGYWMGPWLRGRGATTEACRLVVRHALTPAADGGLGVARVHGRAAVDNAASRRVLAGAGLTELGRERGTVRVLSGGAVVAADAAVYEVLREDLRETPAPR